MRDNPIAKLMLLKPNVIPPFAYDDDEVNKDSSDYVEERTADNFGDAVVVTGGLKINDLITSDSYGSGSRSSS